MQSTTNVASLTRQLDSAKDAKRKLERLERLCKNKDFKELILDEYCVQEAARLVQLSIHPSQNAEDKAKCILMAQAATGVLMYIQVQEQMLSHQASTVGSLETELESARLEEQDGVEQDESED